MARKVKRGNLTKLKKIREDLNTHLINNGAVGEYMTDLVNDYCSLWEVKEKLLADIEERGVQIKWQNSEKSFGYKKNDSVGELLKTSAQMIKILNQLNITPNMFAVFGGDEDVDDFE